MLRRSFLRLLGLAPVAAPMAVAAATAPAVRSLGFGAMAVGELRLEPGVDGWGEPLGSVLEDGAILFNDSDAAERVRRAIEVRDLRPLAHAFKSRRATEGRPAKTGSEPTYLDLYAPEDLIPEDC